MSNRPFRFIHAADLHLEQPVGGLAEVPDHLREAFLEAPYRCARRLFDAALAEEAALVVFSGDVIDPTWTGPRGPLFLIEQFRRLEERGVGVYWAGGWADPPELWPSLLRLPDNVHTFSAGRPEHFIHHRDGEPLARLVGASRQRRRKLRASEYHPDPTNLFTIGVAHGNANPAALRARGIHYWALGGKHSRSTPLSAPVAVHFPGTPQGRRPEESGAHGCTLVEVDEARSVRMSLVPCDVLRWHDERLLVQEQTTREDLEAAMRERLHALAQTSPGLDLLVRFTVAGAGPLGARLRQGRLATEIVERLRREFGYVSPAAWTLSLSVACDHAIPAEHYEQQSIRGDFLRAARRLESRPSEPIDLGAYLAPSGLAGALGPAAVLGDPAVRAGVLGEAAMLGADLLSGEGVPT